MVEVLDSIECKNCVSAFNKLFFYIQDTKERIWVHPEVIRTEIKVIKHKNYLRKVSHFAELENSVLVRTSENDYLLYLDKNYQTIVLKVSDNEKIEIESYNNSSDLTITRVSNLIFITAKGTSDPEILLKIDNELYYIDTKRKRLKRIYSRSLPPSSFGIKEDLYENIVEYGASRGVPVYMKEFIKDNAEDSEDIEYEESVDY